LLIIYFICGFFNKRQNQVVFCLLFFIAICGFFWYNFFYDRTIGGVLVKKYPQKTNKKNVDDMRQYKRKRRKAGNMRWILIGVFMLVCLLAGYFFSRSPFFFIENIKVEGNASIDGQRVIEVSGLEKGQSIFSSNLKKAEEWLPIDPGIKSATVKRKYPNTVIIQVAPRIPLVTLSTGGGFIEVAGDGIVVFRSRTLSGLDLPLLSGVSGFAAGIVPGSRIENEKLEIGLQVVSQFPSGAAEIINEVNVDDTEEIKIYTDNKIEIRIGSPTDFQEKYEILTKIIEDQTQKGKINNIQYIDVGLTSKPVIYYYN